MRAERSRTSATISMTAPSCAAATFVNSGKSVWDKYVGRARIVDGGAGETVESGIDALPQHIVHAAFAVCGHAPQAGLPGHHGLCGFAV